MKVALLGFGPLDYNIAYLNGLAPHAQVHAILPQGEYTGLRQWIDPRIALDFVDWPRTRSLTNPAFLIGLTRRLRRLEPDILHLLSNTTLWLNAAAPFWPWPVVTTVHDVTLHPGDRDTARLPGWAARLMARQSDRLIVHGEALRAAAGPHFGKPADRVHIVPHPAISRYAELARQLDLRRTGAARQVNVLLFGRIFAYKGLETLLRAEALLGGRLPGLRITIAGRGDNPATLAPLMGDPARYDIRHGFVADEAVAQLFTDADIVVLPYDEASQSGVLHVAGSFGKPVVVTDVGELAATVTPNGIGLVVPPRDPTALAEALLRLSQDPALREAQAKRALAWARGANAPSTIGAKAMGVYAEMMRSFPASAPKGCKA